MRKHQSAVKAEEDFCCTICYTSLAEDEILPLGLCDHIFHKECLQDYIEDMINQFKLNILCAHHAQCGKDLSYKDI